MSISNMSRVTSRVAPMSKTHPPRRMEEAAFLGCVQRQKLWIDDIPSHHEMKPWLKPFSLSLSLSLPLRPEGLDSASQRKRCPLIFRGTQYIPFQAFVGWYLQGFRIIPGFLTGGAKWSSQPSTAIIAWGFRFVWETKAPSLLAVFKGSHLVSVSLQL